jgi:hypothetical protein
VRARLREYAEDPDRDIEDADYAADEDLWARHGVDDQRLLASGWTGAELYQHDPALVVALAGSGEDLRRRVTRWARLRGFTMAELIDRPWFARVREAAESGSAVPESVREQVPAHFTPLLVAPQVGPDGRLDLGARQFHAGGLIPDAEGDGSLAETTEVLITTARIENSRYARLNESVRQEFPELTSKPGGRPTG